MREDTEQRKAAEEGGGEIHEVGDKSVLAVCPVGGELKRVARHLAAAAPCLCGLGVFLYVFVAGGVAVVFGLGAVADDEYLCELIQPAARPERLPLVAVDLVESLFDCHPAAFEFDMHQRQPVDEDGYIVSVVEGSALRDILVDDLQAVVGKGLFVEEVDVLGSAVFETDGADIVVLNHLRLARDTEVGVGDMFGEERLPFRVGEAEAVELLYLPAEVGDKVCLGVERQVFVALCLQLADKGLLEVRLALVAGGGLVLWLVGRDYGTLVRLGDDVVWIEHSRSFFLGELGNLEDLVNLGDLGDLEDLEDLEDLVNLEDIGELVILVVLVVLLVFCFLLLVFCSLLRGRRGGRPAPGGSLCVRHTSAL